MSKVRRIYRQAPNTYRPHFILVDASRSVEPLVSLPARVGFGFLCGGATSIVYQCAARFIYKHEIIPREFSHLPVDVPEFLTVIRFAEVFLFLGLLLMILDKHRRVYKFKGRNVSSGVGRIGIILLISGITATTTVFRDRVVPPEQWREAGTWELTTIMLVGMLGGILMLWLDGAGRAVKASATAM
jgi:hypothetical protein